MGNERAKLLKGLQSYLKEMKVAEPAKDLAELARIDMAFHWHLFESCSSHYVREAYKLMRYQLIALRYRSPISNAVSSHQILVDAIGDGDCDVACAELREHVLENEARYWAACSIGSYSVEQDTLTLGK